MLSNKETQLGHFEANYSICGVSIKVQRSYFRKQLVPLKGNFAGSREQPGEINLVSVQVFWIDCLEPAVPSRLRSKSVAWPGCSVSLEAASNRAKWNAVALRFLWSKQVRVLWNTLNGIGILSLCIATDSSAICKAVGTPWKSLMVTAGLWAGVPPFWAVGPVVSQLQSL